MKHLLLISLLLITSCTSLRDLQNACETDHSEFSDIVSCLETSIEEKVFKMDSFEKEYLLNAQSLNEDVRAGKLSETKARLELERLHNQILIERARLQAVQASRIPNQVDCQVVSQNRIACRSY